MLNTAKHITVWYWSHLNQIYFIVFPTGKLKHHSQNLWWQRRANKSQQGVQMTNMGFSGKDAEGRIRFHYIKKSNILSLDASHCGSDLVNDVFVLVEVKGVLLLEVERILRTEQTMPRVLPFESKTNLQYPIHCWYIWQRYGIDHWHIKYSPPCLRPGSARGVISDLGGSARKYHSQSSMDIGADDDDGNIYDDYDDSRVHLGERWTPATITCLSIGPLLHLHTYLSYLIIPNFLHEWTWFLLHFTFVCGLRVGRWGGGWTHWWVTFTCFRLVESFLDYTMITELEWWKWRLLTQLGHRNPMIFKCIVFSGGFNTWCRDGMRLRSAPAATRLTRESQ